MFAICILFFAILLHNSYQILLFVMYHNIIVLYLALFTDNINLYYLTSLKIYNYFEIYS